MIEFRTIDSIPNHRFGSDGSVWRFCHGIPDRKDRPSRWKQLKPKLTKSGYLSIGLRFDGKRTHYRVNRLIAEAFYGPCPSGFECRHLDGTKTNNVVSNLQWGTKSQNQRDRITHGTDSRGSKSKMAKLTEADVVTIRKEYAVGVTQTALARSYGVTQPLISSIVLKKHWQHV